MSVLAIEQLANDSSVAPFVKSARVTFHANGRLTKEEKEIFFTSLANGAKRLQLHLEIACAIYRLILREPYEIHSQN